MAGSQDLSLASLALQSGLTICELVELAHHNDLNAEVMRRPGWSNIPNRLWKGVTKLSAMGYEAGQLRETAVSGAQLEDEVRV
jgi:hypothetical protein